MTSQGPAPTISPAAARSPRSQPTRVGLVIPEQRFSGLPVTGLVEQRLVAFHQPEIARVEIHHHKANIASAGVPRKLGFRLVREVPDEPEAPGEIGISCEWQTTRAEWALFPIAPTAS